MKLSNKILIAFFGFIFLYLTAIFAEIRFTGSPNVMTDDNSIAETVDISGMAYLTINDLDKNIHVVGSDRPRLEVRSISGGLLKNLTYAISGDTLTLSAIESDESKMIRITVFVPQMSLKRITVKNSVLVVKGLESARLQISQNSGRLWMSDSRIGKIDLELTNSLMDISGASDVDTVSTKLEHSTVNIFASLGRLQGSINDGSFIGVNDVGEIQLKKDESSSLRLY